MHLENLKSHEVPGGIRVVIADDEERVAAWTKASWETLLQGQSGSSNEVVTATNGDDLFAKALGLTDRPADVVVLDDNYRTNYGRWKPTEDMLSLIAQTRGIAFDPIKKPDRGSYLVIGVMPDDLYHPNSTNYAILLRYLGFSGTIIVASSDPPDPQYIAREIKALNEYMAEFGKQIGDQPINGVVTKPDRNNESSYATKPGRWGWEYTEVKADDYADAFRVLIAAL